MKILITNKLPNENHLRKFDFRFEKSNFRYLFLTSEDCNKSIQGEEVFGGAGLGDMVLSGLLRGDRRVPRAEEESWLGGANGPF